MAELDDFFAKKDKKKSKPKTKFVTADELVKNLDVTKREVAAAAVAKAKKPEVSAVSSTGGVAVESEIETISTTTTTIKAPEPVEAEEEWKEFEEERRKDYSGLKIGQLNINAQNSQNQAVDSYDDEDEDSEGNANIDSNMKRSGNGPWKKLIPAHEVTQIPVPVETEKSTKSSVYMPPVLRFNQMGSSVGSNVRTRRAAPDITNTEFFPTLNAARPEEQRKKKNEPAFEEVRHGGRVQRVQEQTTAPVAATNRFESLDDDTAS